MSRQILGKNLKLQYTYSIKNTGNHSIWTQVSINNFGKKGDIVLKIWRNVPNFVWNITASREVLEFSKICAQTAQILYSTFWNWLPMHMVWLNYCSFPMLCMVLLNFKQSKITLLKFSLQYLHFSQGY